jgi:hypothetical protein
MSETARRALGEASDQIVEGYLQSYAFVDQEQKALARAIQRFGQERYEPWKKIQSALAKWTGLPEPMRTVLAEYAKALEFVDRASENVSDAIGRGGFNSYTYEDQSA